MNPGLLDCGADLLLYDPPASPAELQVLTGSGAECIPDRRSRFEAFRGFGLI